MQYNLLKLFNLIIKLEFWGFQLKKELENFRNCIKGAEKMLVMHGTGVMDT